MKSIEEQSREYAYRWAKSEKAISEMSFLAGAEAERKRWEGVKEAAEKLLARNFFDRVECYENAAYEPDVNVGRSDELKAAIKALRTKLNH